MVIPKTDILDLLAVPVFVLEPDEAGQMLYVKVNECWCKNAGRRAEDVIGKTALEIFSDHYGAIAFDHHMKAAKSRKTQSYDLVLPLRSTFRNVRTTLMPKLNKHGDVVQLVGSSVDRTGEMQTQEMQANSPTVSSEIEDFIALAAHDLRAPMRNVGHLVDMLRDGFEDRGDGKLEMIDLLEDVAIKATDLISDVLSQAQAGQVNGLHSVFAVEQLADHIFAVLDPLKIHSLSIQNHWFSTDKTALQIILRNLFDNAIKHSGREVVDLFVTATPDLDGMIQITVQDNGCGFKDPAIAFLDGGKLKVETGFGLFAIRRLVKSGGGDIWATNLADKRGSRIQFTLPGSILLPEAMRPMAASLKAV